MVGSISFLQLLSAYLAPLSVSSAVDVPANWIDRVFFGPRPHVWSSWASAEVALVSLEEASWEFCPFCSAAVVVAVVPVIDWSAAMVGGEDGVKVDVKSSLLANVKCEEVAVAVAEEIEVEVEAVVDTLLRFSTAVDVFVIVDWRDASSRGLGDFRATRASDQVDVEFNEFDVSGTTLSSLGTILGVGTFATFVVTGRGSLVLVELLFCVCSKVELVACLQAQSLA